MSDQRAQLAYETFAAGVCTAPLQYPEWRRLSHGERASWHAVVEALDRHDAHPHPGPTEQVVLIKFEPQSPLHIVDHHNGGAFGDWARRFEAQQNSILEAIMKTQADLDAGISTLTADDAAVLAAVASAGTATSKSLADLLAAIKANPGAPASDFTAEVEALAQTHVDFQAALTSLQAVTDSAKSADPGDAAPAAAATTIILTASPAAPDTATTITLSGSVVGGATTPTGSVTITDSTGAVSTSATLDSTGAFTTTTGPLTAGGFSLTASYGGDAANAPSTASLSISVVAAAAPGDSGDVQTLPGGPVTEV